MAISSTSKGLHLPHIAAGINLNMPVVGGILRRGGAFFLRRSFKGNRLYAAVFDAYLNQILQRGHSIEYFVEGGRSRTGRLLAPKGGMLVMTINSYVKNPQRPIVFVPIYFGYEKLIEGDSFISEMGGAEKKKESLGGLIRSIKSLARALRQRLRQYRRTDRAGAGARPNAAGMARATNRRTANDRQWLAGRRR